MKHLNHKYLGDLKDNLLHSSLCKLNTGKDTDNFKESLENLTYINHLFEADYLGFEGCFTKIMIIRLWYYYRKTNNISLDINPINEKIHSEINLEEDEEEIYEYLLPLFQDLIDNDRLLVITLTELVPEQLNTYLGLVKKIQKQYTKVIDEFNITEVIDESNNDIDDIIKKINEYDTNYIVIGHIQNTYTITNFTNNNMNINSIDLGQNKITMIKSFVF
jgi:hypothetical protein